MNSKELLEQAEKRIAEVESISAAKHDIEDLERLLKIGENEFYVLHYCGDVNLDIENSLCIEHYGRLGNIIKATFEEFLHEKYSSLEKLLSIRKPATINPEFEAAVQGMEQSTTKPKLVAETSNSKYFEVKNLSRSKRNYLSSSREKLRSSRISQLHPS